MTMLTRDELERIRKRSWHEFPEQAPTDSARQVISLLTHIDAQRTLIAEMAAVLAKVQYGLNGQCPICGRLVLSTQVNVASEHASGCDIAAVLAKAKEVTG